MSDTSLLAAAPDGSLRVAQRLGDGDWARVVSDTADARPQPLRLFLLPTAGKMRPRSELLPRLFDAVAEAEVTAVHYRA